MFSYRHAFHVGNHADVLKHAILVAILRHLALKDKAFWVFDTHAGAGRYRLDAASSSKNREHEGGVMALWREKALPALLADYRDEVACFDRRWRKPAAAWRGATGRDAAPVDAARAGRGAGRGKKYLFIYLREWGERGRGRGRERISKQTPRGMWSPAWGLVFPP